MRREGSTLLDCRWIGYSGKGRVTEHLLGGLAEIEPDGEWLLWGDPERLNDRSWPGAKVVPSRHSPLAWAGQRDLLHLPRADRFVFLHAVRPMRGRRALVLLHDTIPLRWGNGWMRARLWRSYLKLSCRLADATFVYSKATWRRAIDDLGVTPIGIVALPIDHPRFTRIREHRKKAPPEAGLMLYVGLFRPQKNLSRAVAAFARASFSQEGGRFVIVGSDENAPRVLSKVAGGKSGQLEFVTSCSERELDMLYASATLLIQPSLEEGFGLPVLEALASGVPVCCSEIPELIEASQGLAELFDPHSVEGMAAAIDRTAADAAKGVVPADPSTSRPRQFAEEVLYLLANRTV